MRTRIRVLEITRRHFFRECGVGVGKIALASLLTDACRRRRLGAAPAAATRSRRSRRTSRPKAKAVIHLFMAGAPSQLDLFDYKPELAKLEGKPLPPSVIGGQRYAFIRPDAAVLGPRFKFARHGQSGAELSEMLPHLAERRRRHLPHQVGARPTSSTTPRRRSSSTPASRSRAGPSIGSWVDVRPGRGDAATCRRSS